MSLDIKNLVLGYEDKIIVNNIDISISKGEITILIGANGCGKSTLLSGMSRLLIPKEGNVFLEGKSIHDYKPKELAKKLAILPQGPIAPEGITVKELCYFGRNPYKSLFGGRSKEDEEIVNWAIENVGLTKYKNTPVSTLSGGERQRAHLAQALCQKPEILLLDEPTTYLDISHQLELMELVREINKNLNITIIMVLHDLNQASKYSDRLVIMKNGNIVADGHPNETISHDIIRDVYGVKCDIDHDPISKKPRIHPIETIKAIV